MRLQFTVAMIVALGLAGPVAAADTLDGTRGELREQRHEIRITMYPGHATLVVRRTMLNPGERHDQAVYHLNVPEGAVAVGLRTRGLLHGRPAWFAGELMEAEAAAAKYQELTGRGGYYPKDPALLSWRSQDELALQVFPLPPGENKTVEYTLALPTEWEGGRHVLALPRLGLDDPRPDIVVRAASQGDSLWVDGRPFPDGGAMAWPENLVASERACTSRQRSCGAKSTGDELLIELQPRAAPLLGGRMAVQPFAPGGVLVHYQVEAAPRLSRVPARASIVVLLDDSRSMDEGEQAAGGDAIGAVLRRLPDAQVAVLAFARKVTPVYPGFRPSVLARQAIEAYERRRDNGSRIDDALRRADELLSRTPAGRPRRVYLLTDLLARKALDPLTLRAALRRSGAVVHVGQIQQGSPELTPDQDGPWATLARASGGLLWTGSAGGAVKDDDEMARIYEEWVRPTRLYDFGVKGPAAQARVDDDGPDPAHDRATLDEGESVSFLGITREPPVNVQAWGELWSRRVRITVAPDPIEARVWSALVFGSDVMHGLSEREMMVLAVRGRAVSPVTSYLAIEPGVRPSTEGLVEGEGSGGGGTGEGTIGLGGLNTIGSGRTYDHRAFLREAVASAWKECGGHGPVTVHIETTLTEVVDVPMVRITGKGSASCLEEAIWRLELPSPFDAVHETWEIGV